MRIAIRMDDITPDMDWNRFYAFKAILDQYQVKPLIGVIPDNRDNTFRSKDSEQRPNDFWQFIKELQKQGWVIAMHGCYHCYDTKKGGLFPLNNFSEFAGQSYEKQYEMLQHAKQMLTEKGIRTDFFMAPAHSYDKNTLRALRELDFKKITDGFGNRPYQWQGLTFYPISFHIRNSLKKKKGFSTMVIHTDTMSENDRERIRNYLQNPGQTEWISYEEYLKEPVIRRGTLGHINEFILAKCKFLLVKMRSR